MPDSLGYASEVYNKAVRILATHPADIRTRLRPAIIEALHARTEGLTDEIGATLEDFHARMTNIGSTGNEGTITATVAAMTDDEAVGAANELCSLAYDLDQECRGALEDSRRTLT